MTKFKPKPMDYVSTALQIFFILTSMVYILVRQTIWLVTYKLGRDNNIKLIKRASSNVNRRMSRALSQGIPDEDDDQETQEAKFDRCTRTVNGAAAVHGAIQNYFLKFNPFWRRHLEFETSTADLNKNTHIYMGNHTSFSDFVFLAGLGINLTAVGKSDLLELPFAGRVLKNAGYLPVHFRKKANGKWGTDEEKTKVMLRDAVDYLRYGASILVFPEGKITLGTDLGEFKPGFFNVAKSADVDIVPFAIWGAEQAWPMRNPSIPNSVLSRGDVYVKIGTPMKRLTATLCSTLESEDDMAKTLEAMYAINLGEDELTEDILGAVRVVLDMNGTEEATATEEYHKAVGDLYRFVVRKKIHEMRGELMVKHAKEGAKP